MRVYTFSRARQQLASVLDEARREGKVRIRRRDGQLFEVRPARTSGSPLDVRAIRTKVGTEEIVSAVRESRSARDRWIWRGLRNNKPLRRTKARTPSRRKRG